MHKAVTGRRSKVLSLQTQSNCLSWESLAPLRRQSKERAKAGLGRDCQWCRHICRASPLCLPACVLQTRPPSLLLQSFWIFKQASWWREAALSRWANKPLYFVPGLTRREGGSRRSNWPSSSAPPCWGRLKSWWRTRTGATPQISTSCTGRTACSLACTSSAA